VLLSLIDPAEEFGENTDCCYHSGESFAELVRLTNASNLLIIHQNIRSFNRNFDEFSALLDSIDSRFHVIVFTETWFAADSTIDISGYIGYHSYRTGRLGGGVSIYIHRSLSSTQLYPLTVNCELYEVCAAQIVLDKCKLYIIGMYLAPNNVEFDLRLTSLVTLLENSNILHGLVYMAGDFNVNMLSSTAKSRQFSDAMRSLSLLPLINLPTRVTHDSETLIDNIWSNQNAHVAAGVLTANVTDHFPIFTILCFDVGNRCTTKMFRDHSEVALAKFVSDLEDFTANYTRDNNYDINVSLKYFLDQLMQIYNTCCPIRSKSYSIHSIARPWINRRMRAVVDRKHYLFRQYKSGGCSFEFYNNYKNHVTKELRKAKREYYNRKLNNGNCDQSEMWRVVRNLSNKNKERSNISLTVNGSLTSDPMTVTATFNEYFSSVANDIERDIPAGATNPMEYMASYETRQSFFAIPATPHEVSSIIAKLKCKGCPLTEIPNFIVKKVSRLICRILSDFFNESVTVGVFPEFLKLARVVPIYKAGNKTIPGNYRPICALSVFSKIFETLMCNRMKQYIDRFSILNSNQFGFVRNSCTADAISEFVDRIYTSVDNREYFVTVFLDFRKAFDTVDHGILLGKLGMLGFRGPVNDWLRSYLLDRRQFVAVCGTCSDTQIVNRGIPQGSVLGPLLFNLYINDMSSATRLSVIHYADDTTVFHSGSELAEITEVINAELLSLDEWLRSNRLCLNADKSRAMIITKRVIGDVPVVKIRDSELEIANEMKFLGIIIDSNLSFMPHCTNVIAKLSRVLGMMRKMSYILPRKSLRILYYSLFYSNMTYAIIVWGNASVMAVGRIESIQRRVVGLLDRYRVAADSFDTFRLLKYSCVYSYFCVLKIHRIFNNNHLYFLEKIISVQVSHGYRTRNSDARVLTNVYCRTACSQRGFLYQAVKYWNELPVSLRDIVDVRKFKSSVKLHYLRLL